MEKITAVAALVRVKERRDGANSSVRQLVIDVSAITVHKPRAQFRHTAPADIPEQRRQSVAGNGPTYTVV